MFSNAYDMNNISVIENFIPTTKQKLLHILTLSIQQNIFNLNQTKKKTSIQNILQWLPFV